jgi:RNA polymerase sigma-70 factor (ECF subfamily)
MNDSSEVLVERARGGDRRAIESLIAQHLPALRAFVRLRAGRELRAQESQSDLVQSACRSALEGLSAFEYRGEAAFRHWLYPAVERKILDRGRCPGRERRDARRKEAISPLAHPVSSLLDCYATFCTPSPQAVAHEEAERVEHAIDELPESYRNVLRLKYVVGLSNEELGFELGRTQEYTRMFLARARHRLAVLLDAGGE